MSANDYDLWQARTRATQGGAVADASGNFRPAPTERRPGDKPGVIATPSSLRCTRITVICLCAMCCVWPALIAVGAALAASTNEQQAQRDAFAVSVAAFDTRTRDVVLTTSAVTRFETSPRTLTPAYQLLVDTPFPKTRTVVLQTATRDPVAETQGSNLGSISAQITYRQGEDSTVGQTYIFTSPPITITRPATKAVSCTAPYAGICGTTTCCTATEMQRQCSTIVRAFSSSSPVSFVPNENDCRLGVECGYCQYRQTVSDLCFVISWSALTGWSADESKSSCQYPFLPSGQIYSDSDAGATLTLRAADDPYIVVQEMTGGSLQLDDDGSVARSQGRGLILFGSLLLLLALCVGVLAKCCGTDVLTETSVKRAFGIAKSEPAPETLRPTREIHAEPQFRSSTPTRWNMPLEHRSPERPQHQTSYYAQGSPTAFQFEESGGEPLFYRSAQRLYPAQQQSRPNFVDDDL